MTSRHSEECEPSCSCYAAGIEDGRELERSTIEGILATTFAQQDPGRADRETWQRVLHSVEERAYLRGLKEGLADD